MNKDGGILESKFIAERYRSMLDSMQVCEQPGIPRSMLLEPTNACNLKCNFCYNASSERRISLLDTNLARRILEEAFSLGVREVGFYLNGEPLLHPELDKMTAMAKQIGFSYIYLTTNGVLAEPDRIANLVKNGLNSIKFSINAGERRDYQEIHGVDAFAVVLDNLEGILGRREELASLGLRRIMVSSVLNSGDDGNKGIIALKGKFDQLLDDYALYQCEPQPKIGAKERFIDLCPHPFTQLFITSSGMLTLCCKDSDNYLAVANLAQQTIHDAWHGELARSLRRRLIENDLGNTLCARCLTGATPIIEPLSIELHRV